MSRILSIYLFITFLFVSIFTPLLYAKQSDNLKIIAIVLSKTCPLPDGPGLAIDSPESILKSIDNPECPKQGDNQLIQTALVNQNSEAQSVGVEILLHLDGQEMQKKRFRKTYTIAARDTLRILHEVKLEDTGLYKVSVQIWDSSFRSILMKNSQGDERYFFIASSQDVEVAENQMVSGGTAGARRASALEFDPADLKWESVQVLPKHALRGEKLRVRLNLINVGGDVVKGVGTKVQYYNVRQPMRKSVIAMPSAHVMAPGEIVTFDLDYLLPEDQLLGEYQIIATVDPENLIEEMKEDNNIAESNVIQLSDIKLLLPTDNFVFEENGLFLFQWDSLAFSEFKIQVGVDEKFEDTGAFFNLPQGNRWIADKELVPLAGELPGMAMGLMKAMKKNKLYWRVTGRQASGRQAMSGVRSFTITPVSSNN